MFTFVSGGVRSGKSSYALSRASELGPPPWLYVAPQVEGDEELKTALMKHRREQDAIWRVKEASAHLSEAVDQAVIEGNGAMVLDRFSIWLSDRIDADAATRDNPQDIEQKIARDEAKDRALLDEVADLADRLYHCSIPVVIVTTEVGLGFRPSSASDRRLVNIVGAANLILAERAQSVVFMISGIAQRLR